MLITVGSIPNGSPSARRAERSRPRRAAGLGDRRSALRTIGLRPRGARATPVWRPRRGFRP